MQRAHGRLFERENDLLVFRAVGGSPIPWVIAGAGGIIARGIVGVPVGGAVLAAGAIWGIVNVVGSSKSDSDATRAATVRLRVGPLSASIWLGF